MTKPILDAEFKAAVYACLLEYAPIPVSIEITDDTDLAEDLGLTSQTGAELADEVCSRFRVRIERADNPIVCDDIHTGKRRLRKAAEVVEYIKSLPAETE